MFSLQEHKILHIPKGIRDFGPVPEGTSTMRGEQNHSTFKSIVADSHNRKDVLGMPATNHDRKIAFLTKREPIVSPNFVVQIKSVSKKETNRKKAIRDRRQKKWESFSRGPLVELKSLQVMNTEIRRNTLYWKSPKKMVTVDYLVKRQEGPEVGFVGRVIKFVEDKSTGLLKFDKNQETHPNLVLLDTFKSTFIGKKTVKEHWLRRGCYYKYNFPNGCLCFKCSICSHCKNWLALVP